MTIRLSSAVARNEATFPVTGGTQSSSSFVAQIDDEKVIVIGSYPSWLNVERAAYGTAGSDHQAGAVITPIATPEPAAPTAAIAADFVEPTTATPEAIATVLIAAGLMEAS